MVGQGPNRYGIPVVSMVLSAWERPCDMHMSVLYLRIPSRKSMLAADGWVAHEAPAQYRTLLRYD